ncbi:hypothetical protein SNE35_31145 [Paucibacter sp. R3-3]|uniref:Gasdermin bGSDM n=1 Tax=Roseateles agri TaxID=3098619 RepID=A0ABU5DT21_9BURK|nr:hypothetical protein [Paucibacter sp. R3-3]MDY0748996.1 hypothetical protein [Paucibacter sp. R3-3]
MAHSSAEPVMFCKDPAIAFLKDIGYSVIRLPRRDFTPLLMLAGENKALEALGTLDGVLVGEKLAPAIVADEPVADISGQRTSELSLGIGLNILGNIIGAMGGSKLALDAAYKSARSVSFEFVDVLRDSVRISDLDKYLGASDVDPGAKTIGQMLEASDVFVVTSILKSRRISVAAKSDSNAELSLDVPTIQGIVGGKVKVSAAVSASHVLSYEGEVPLVFGFQAVRLFYDEGRYTAFEPAADVAARAVRDLEKPSTLPEGVKAFVSNGAFARLG